MAGATYDDFGPARAERSNLRPALQSALIQLGVGSEVFVDDGLTRVNSEPVFLVKLTREVPGLKELLPSVGGIPVVYEYAGRPRLAER